MFKKSFCWLNAARALGAGVAQPGWSVRLIIERSRARIPLPAPFTSIIPYARMSRGDRFGLYDVNFWVVVSLYVEFGF